MHWVERAFVALAILAVAGAILVRYSGLNLYALGPPTGMAILALGAIMLVGVLAAQIGFLRAAGASALVCTVCIVAEVSGLSNGIPFGVYDYTWLWKPAIRMANGKLFPLFLPLAWFILIACSHQVAAAKVDGWRCDLLTGKVVSAIDLVLEPAMTGPVGFWKWESPHPWLAAPITNCIGWFLVGTLGGAILRKFGVRPDYASTAGRLLTLVVVCTFLIGVTHREYRVVWAVPVLALLYLVTRSRNAEQATPRR